MTSPPPPVSPVIPPAPPPLVRPRRLRRSPLLRNALADVTVRPQNLIYPLFVTDDPQPVPVSAMPGVHQLPVEHALKLIHDLAERGLKQFLLFGVTPESKKDDVGSYARSPHAPVNRTLRAVRHAQLDVLLYADLCFCEYTRHGHCGPLHHTPRRSPLQRAGPQTPPQTAPESVDVDNDRTIALLGETARVQADSGADVVAPSGMMDNQVAAIRQALDAAGHTDTAILSYSVKYASSFYGPFREAGGGGMQFGDRCGYQMDFRRTREWRTELDLDLAQGADMVMVKPAAAYLDIIHQVRQATSVPVAAYHVSGEYAMLHAAAAAGSLDLKAAALETTCAIRRAGADLIITYFAPQLLDWLG